MKRLILPLLFALFIQPTIASDLVLIPIKSFQEKHILFGKDFLTIHYYTNSFVIATSESGVQDEFILLDQSPWEEEQSYYVVYLNENDAKSDYLSQIESTADVLYNGAEFLVVKTNEKEHGQLIPAKNDGMIRIQNFKAKLPDYSFANKVVTPTEADPFIEELLNEVNTTNLTNYVQTLQDFDTRNAYSAQSFSAQNWISKHFEDLGLSVEIMDFYMPGGNGSDNVIAKQVGTSLPNEYVVVGGHYDSYSSSGLAPGADDNASGTSGVMEIARILSEYEFDRTIIYCAFSGEEYGLYGSAAFANRSSQQGMDIIGYVNLDMIGYLQPGGSMMTSLVYPQSAQELANFYTSVCSIYLPNFTIQPGTLSGANSDHYSFNVNGYMGIFPFENINAYSPYIHSPNDVVGTSYNNEDQAGVFTKAALASVAIMAADGLNSISTSLAKLKVYPNPANELVEIVLVDGGKAKLDVFSIQGQLTYSKYIENGESVNVSNWPKNIYIFRISTSKGVLIQKVVKN